MVAGGNYGQFCVGLHGVKKALVATWELKATGRQGRKGRCRRDALRDGWERPWYEGRGGNKIG